MSPRAAALALALALGLASGALLAAAPTAAQPRQRGALERTAIGPWLLVRFQDGCALSIGNQNGDRFVLRGTTGEGLVLGILNPSWGFAPGERVAYRVVLNRLHRYNFVAAASEAETPHALWAPVSNSTHPEFIRRLRSAGDIEANFGGGARSFSADPGVSGISGVAMDTFAECLRQVEGQRQPGHHGRGW